MGIYKKIRGIMESLFQIGGPSGNQIKNTTNTLDIRNNDDSDFQNIRFANADGTDDSHGINYKLLRDTDTLITFDFDGASAPAAGTNTGEYGFCHTSGGAYTAGIIYYDSGTSLDAIIIKVGTKMATSTAITGTVSMIANGLYVATSASAPHNWTLKGDGTTAALLKTIKMAVGTSASTSSTTSIPDGSKVMEVISDITSAYDNNATLQIIVDGTSDQTIQDVDENDPSSINIYSNEPLVNITSSTEGVVTVNITNSPTTGSADIYVRYAESFLA